MFVKNLTKEVIDFRKNGRVLKLKPGVNLVDEFKWSKEDLMNTYGPTILAFFTEEKVEEPTEEAQQDADVVETPVKDETPAPTEGNDAPIDEEGQEPAGEEGQEEPVVEGGVAEGEVVEGEQKDEAGQEAPVDGQAESDKAEETVPADKAPAKKPATKRTTKKANK